jgi:hypothetical protein
VLITDVPLFVWETTGAENASANQTAPNVGVAEQDFMVEHCF